MKKSRLVVFKILPSHQAYANENNIISCTICSSFRNMHLNFKNILWVVYNKLILFIKITGFINLKKNEYINRQTAIHRARLDGLDNVTIYDISFIYCFVFLKCLKIDKSLLIAIFFFFYSWTLHAIGLFSGRVRIVWITKSFI